MKRPVVNASIVVLNYNSGSDLEPCLASLLALDADDYEVVLIDNASTDGSREQASERFSSSPRFRLVALPRNLGCAGGRNRGIAEARGDLICFVDSDAHADPGWLSGVRRQFEDPSVGVVASRLVSARNPRVLNGLGGMLNWQGYGFDIGFGEPAEFAEAGIEPLFACGNGLCTRRQVVARVGGFDETYFNYYEDVDFSLRARRAGYDLRLAPDATLYHVLKPGEPQASHARTLLCERNRIRTVLRHFPLRMLKRWYEQEQRHEQDPAVSGYYREGLFDEAWRWNVRRLPAIAWWRLRQLGRLRPLDLRRHLLPAWGYAPAKIHNIALEPQPRAVGSRLTIGEDDADQLLYGWYAQELSADGFMYRWTDDLAALRLTATRPQATLRLSYFHPEDHRGTWLYARHTATGAAVTGRLPLGHPLWWIEAQVATPLPAGEIELILQTPDPLREPPPGTRSLGVALRHCWFD